MPTFNELPGGRIKDLIFTTLYNSGKDSSGSQTYTTLDSYDYIIISAHATANATNEPNPTCDKGTLIGTYYNNTAGGSGTQVRTSIRIWKKVDSGAVCNFTAGNRHGWCITGANWNDSI